MPELIDSYGRRIEYLRISVTDRCNLRCIYCMPPQGIQLCPPQEVLSFEEIELVARTAVSLGMDRIRLTGGEPLVRRSIADLVTRLSKIPGLRDLSLTTNGTSLADHALALAQAGLQRVNISLDTLRPEAYSKLTRGGDLSSVLRGIDVALQVGLDPVKINVVITDDLISGEPDDLGRFAQLTRSRPLHVRFIEMMPLGDQAAARRKPIPANLVRSRLAAVADLAPVAGPEGCGPARYFRYPGAPGTIGFISPLSDRFCMRCNRLRLTAKGGLRPCLWADQEIDLKTLLRGGGGEAEIREAIRQAVAAKPESYPEDLNRPEFQSMCQIGG